MKDLLKREVAKGTRYGKEIEEALSQKERVSTSTIIAIFQTRCRAAATAVSHRRLSSRHFAAFAFEKEVGKCHSVLHFDDPEHVMRERLAADGVDADVITRRLEEYAERSLPLIEFYSKLGMVKTISTYGGSDDHDLIFEQVRACLEPSVVFVLGGAPRADQRRVRRHRRGLWLRAPIASSILEEEAAEERPLPQAKETFGERQRGSRGHYDALFAPLWTPTSRTSCHQRLSAVVGAAQGVRERRDGCTICAEDRRRGVIARRRSQPRRNGKAARFGRGNWRERSQSNQGTLSPKDCPYSWFRGQRLRGAFRERRAPLRLHPPRCCGGAHVRAEPWICARPASEGDDAEIQILPVDLKLRMLMRRWSPAAPTNLLCAAFPRRSITTRHSWVALGRQKWRYTQVRGEGVQGAAA